MIHDHMAHFFVIKGGSKIRDQVAHFFIDIHSLYERDGFKRTEFASCVFDHVSGRFKKGFRLLTPGWTDGCTFLPINFSMLASSKEHNVLGSCNHFNRRSLCGKRRIMARQKATHVMLELIGAQGRSSCEVCLV